MERVDAEGRWESADGAAWLLVEPSQEFLDGRAVDEEVVASVPDLAAALAGLSTALAPLTPSSTMATVRTALLNARAALDAALAQP